MESVAPLEFPDWLWTLGVVWSAVLCLALPDGRVAEVVLVPREDPATLGPRGPVWLPGGRRHGEKTLATSVRVLSAERAGAQDAIKARVLG